MVVGSNQHSPSSSKCVKVGLTRDWGFSRGILSITLPAALPETLDMTPSGNRPHVHLAQNIVWLKLHQNGAIGCNKAGYLKPKAMPDWKQTCPIRTWENGILWCQNVSLGLTILFYSVGERSETFYDRVST